MEKEKQILIEVEKTLNSFDNDIILEENPFLFTRINTELNNRRKKQKRGLIFQVNFKQALLMIILLLNLITIVYYYNQKSSQSLEENLVNELKADFDIDQTQNIF